MSFSSVPTQTTGNLWTAANHNTYIKDNLDYLHGDAGAIALNDALTSAKANVGSNQSSIFDNTDNTNASSGSEVRIRSGGASAGDALLILAVTGVTSYHIGVDNSDGDLLKLGSGTVVGTTDVMVLNTTGQVFIGDTSDADSTVGLTLNQGANDDAILDLKSSDVAHGMTSVAETDTYAAFKKRDANNGGLQIAGYTEVSIGLHLIGRYVTGDTTKSTAGLAAVTLAGEKKSGTTATSPGANENLFAVQGPTGTTQFIVDIEGDYFYNGTGTVYDAHDDVQLVRALEIEREPKNILRTEFDKFVRYNRADLERLGVAHFNDGPGQDGIVFINGAALARLHSGAIWQLSTKLQTLASRLVAAGLPAALLEGL